MDEVWLCVVRPQVRQHIGDGDVVVPAEGGAAAGDDRRNWFSSAWCSCTTSSLGLAEAFSCV
jgi:hypothetical protein